MKNIKTHLFTINKNELKFIKNNYAKFKINNIFWIIKNKININIFFSQSLIKILPYVIQSAIFFYDELTFIINKNFNYFMIFFLKMHSFTLYCTISNMYAVDYINKFNRYEINYILLSIVYNTRLRLKMCLSEFDKINSITKIFLNADWFEKEIFDLFGIFFLKNTNLYKILTNYGFIGNPLKKDFPMIGLNELIYYDNERCLKYIKIEYFNKTKLNLKYNNFFN